MKNIYTILEGINITIPEDRKADFETAFNENYKTVSEVEKLRNARDSYKSQLDTATTRLKSFEGSAKLLTPSTFTLQKRCLSLANDVFTPSIFTL